MSTTHSRADQIIAAAREAFAEHGYDQTSMAEIARRVGVVEGAIYRHFPSKLEVLNRVIGSFYEPLIESTRTGMAAIDAPRERLRWIIHRHLRAMTEDRLVCRLVIAEARSLDGDQASPVADLNRRYTAIALETILDGVRRGDFRADLPATMVRDLIYGSIEHLSWRVLTGRGEVDVDTTTDHLVSLVLDGLGTHTPSPLGLSTQVDRLEALADRLDVTLEASSDGRTES